ncbi:sugar ABC transporter substrate-binding protein [Planobispora rosea]|uniref:Sugar ABC transporter substrate-binding protein n=1 Tax=Planobispora rosea TaxID=35762 RepID=A0A8J3S9K2_PLARO|nr:ABC transporter substrate-binding protein [Planobispora rosea]GGS95887.1 sugar ABC transporter substrate-binding protein [Planobispora rosea]GIH87564.1 sugar ABC transporter substrate-binding protein [Planobispora rosea]
MRARLTLLTAGLLLATAACAGNGPATEQPADAKPSGTITVLTNRTDLVDTAFKEYAKRFTELHPGVEVKFEGITNYEDEVRIRMNTPEYGDVLLIPNSVTPSQLPSFFEPLGSTQELGKKYRFINEQAYDGKVYGIATFGNAQGFVYNKRVFEAAGVTDWPTTPDEFIADLKLVREKTGAIPYYTNYAAGWPLTMWESFRGSLSADRDYVSGLAHTDAPWAAGTDHHTIDSLLHRIAAEGLIEKDPTTSDWEESKKLIGSGKVASMALGSWAIVQMQEAAASPDDIGFMPFPQQNAGKFHATIAGDWKIAINKHSENKVTARAWLDFFVDRSGYAADSGSIPPVADAPLPEQLKPLEDKDVQFVEQNPAPANETGLTNDIDEKSEIGLNQPEYRQRIVDAGRGASEESLEAIFTDLNAKWKTARAALAGN